MDGNSDNLYNKIMDRPPLGHEHSPTNIVRNILQLYGKYLGIKLRYIDHLQPFKYYVKHKSNT